MDEIRNLLGAESLEQIEQWIAPVLLWLGGVSLVGRPVSAGLIATGAKLRDFAATTRVTWDDRAGDVVAAAGEWLAKLCDLLDAVLPRIPFRASRPAAPPPPPRRASNSVVVGGLVLLATLSGCGASALQRQAVYSDASAIVVNDARGQIRAFYRRAQFDALRQVCSPEYIDGLEAAIAEGVEIAPVPIAVSGCSRDEWAAAVASVRLTYRERVEPTYALAQSAHEAWRNAVNAAIDAKAEDDSTLARVVRDAGAEFVAVWNRLGGLIRSVWGFELPALPEME